MTRIIIADDHPIIISGAEALLRGSDYEIVGKASNGAQALAAIATNRPDILVMDINMPVTSGIEVLNEIRSRGDNLPIVLITAGSDPRTIAAAIHVGVDGFVLKDAAAESLLLCLDIVREGGRWIDPRLQAMSDKTEHRPHDPLSIEPDVLSRRELDVAVLVSRGLRNREIAAELGITEGTVKLHLHRIYEKLGIGSRTELAILGRDRM